MKPASKYPEFFVVYKPSVNNSHKMRINDGFLAMLSAEDALGKRVVLRNGARRVFYVEVREDMENGGVYFDGGWKVFISRNGIRDGYVMLFRYEGGNMFDVHIFDHSGCEMFIQDCVDVVKVEDTSESDEFDTMDDEVSEEEEDDGEEEEDEDYEDEDFDNESSYDSLVYASSDADDSMDFTPRAPQPSIPTTQLNVPVSSAELKAKKLAHEEHNVALRQKLKAKAIAQVKPEKPYFILHIDEQQVTKERKYAYIPRDFTKYLKRSTVEGIIFDPIEKVNWPVKVYCGGSSGNMMICTGWPKFMRGNKLRENDTCLFELISPDPLRLNVSFLRAAEA